ncbi:MAG TPA: DUF4082 domain-containing protein [Candidatus Saccharimonadales bacterium]|nr:DUF4082 domain-containing protein [Candidatus Saccharimonadales bacterium]
MPSPKKSGTSRTTTNRKTKKKGSWLGRLWARRYAKPAIVIVAFMIVGTGSLLWAMAASTTTSLWSDSTVPATLASSDTSNIELGLRFKSDVAGYVTGVRFYKSAQNTGVHTGNLWDNKGNLLAMVTFSNESTSGWQTANFTQPVSVAANTVYVISYHAPNGHYSYNTRYFSRNAYTNGHLTAIKTSSTRPNGIYTKNANQSVFPSTSANGTNYWVDVLFTTSLLNPQPGPAAPSGVSAIAQDSTTALVSWQASQSANPVTDYLVYRDGGKIADVGTGLIYTDSSLSAGSTHTYQVQAVDSTGVSSALSATATVTLPSGTTTGSTTTCPLPKYPDATCTGVPAGITLSNYTGPTTITTAGTIINGKNITSCIEVNAPSVVIENSKISCNPGGGDAVASYDGAYDGTPLVIQDSEIDCQNLTGTTAVGDTNITTYRLNIHGCENGYDIDAYLTINDNYIHDLANSSDSHTDGIQFAIGHYVSASNHTIINGVTQVIINHNTILSRGVDGTDTTSAIISNRGGDSNVLIQNNLLAGGAYTLYCEQNATGVNYQVLNNHFSTIYHPTVGAYGPSTDCSDEIQSGNVYHETGQPLTLE